MTPIRVVNKTRGTELGRRIQLAETLFQRLRGFLFRTGPSDGEGLLLTPCQAVHMVGVPFSLDVLFIDEGGRVVGLYPDLKPMRWTHVHRTASHALELPRGTITRTRTELGDALLWSPIAEERDIIELAAHEAEDESPNRLRKEA